MHRKIPLSSFATCSHARLPLGLAQTGVLELLGLIWRQVAKTTKKKTCLLIPMYLLLTQISIKLFKLINLALSGFLSSGTSGCCPMLQHLYCCFNYSLCNPLARSKIPPQSSNMFSKRLSSTKLPCSYSLFTFQWVKIPKYRAFLSVITPISFFLNCLWVKKVHRILLCLIISAWIDLLYLCLMSCKLCLSFSV